MAFEQLDLDHVQDVTQAKRAIVGLLNLVEDLQATVRELQAEVQRLRDENKHLKGEQGQPDFKPNRRGKPPGPGPRPLVRSRSAANPRCGRRAASWPRSPLTAKPC